MPCSCGATYAAPAVALSAHTNGVVRRVASENVRWSAMSRGRRIALLLTVAALAFFATGLALEIASNARTWEIFFVGGCVLGIVAAVFRFREWSNRR